MKLNTYIDHTNLRPYATEADILKSCEEAKEYGFASVCVNPCNVALVAHALAGSDVKTCSVVGFPFGTHTTAIKVAETAAALADGADEIDMVINIGKLLEGDETYVENEVKVLAQLCHSQGKLLKVIIETCYLNEAQIAAMCRIVEAAGADFIKTSTGYGTRGASEEDIALFKKYLKIPAKIKASGGIRTAEDAMRYVELGCERLGTSNGVAIVTGAQAESAY
jgi:deoxyribose-phosphate aldolase